MARCPTYLNTGRGAVEYVSPQWRSLSLGEAAVRRIAYALKEASPPRWALDCAVQHMRRLVPPGATLVPIPASSGSIEANLALAHALAKAVPQTRVEQILAQTGARVSLSATRKAGGRPCVQPEALLFTGLRDVDPDETVVFVDNVMTTGTTFEAARQAVGAGTGVAFAQVHPSRFQQLDGADVP